MGAERAWGGRYRRTLPGLAFGLALAAVTAEVAVRLLNPSPRAQIIRARGPGRPGLPVQVIDGQPTWRSDGSDARENASCVGDRHVLMLGSSITFGTSYSAPEVMSGQLQRLLDEAEPGRWCVHNHGQPAYTGWSKLAEARRVLPALKPDLVIWELWGNDPGRFQAIGPDWYNLDGLRRGPDGLPWVVPVPSAVNAWLFGHSRAWEFGTIALSPLEEGGPGVRWERFQADFMPALSRLLVERPVRLLMMEATPLDRPFAESAAQTSHVGQAFGPWLVARGIPVVRLAEALTGEDPVALRHDPCCHFNPAGHRRVAEVLLPWVRGER